jgi:hypothetical protein
VWPTLSFGDAVGRITALATLYSGVSSHADVPLPLERRSFVLLEHVLRAGVVTQKKSNLIALLGTRASTGAKSAFRATISVPWRTIRVSLGWNCGFVEVPTNVKQFVVMDVRLHTSCTNFGQGLGEGYCVC